MQFQAALIEPADAPAVKAPERVPLLFYFAGLGCLGGLSHADAESFARVAPAAFVVVAPLRQPGKWWTISDDGEWGWVDGDFLPDMVQLLVDWVRALARQPGVDPSNLTALGFSAGAYAVTEILAHGQAPLKGVLIGGVHGHAQPGMEGISGSRRMKKEDEVHAKWQAYLDRLQCHGGAPRGIFGVHDRGDMVCPWPYAEEIYGTLNARQLQLSYRRVEVKMLSIAKTRKNKTLHNYHDAALHDPDLIRRLLTRCEEEDPGAVPATSSQSAPSCMLRWARKKRPLTPPTEPDKDSERDLFPCPSARDHEHEAVKVLTPVPWWSLRASVETRGRTARSLPSPARSRAAHAPETEEGSSGFHSPGRPARDPAPEKRPESLNGCRLPAKRPREPSPAREREPPRGSRSRSPAKRQREPACGMGCESPDVVHIRIPAQMPRASDPARGPLADGAHPDHGTVGHRLLLCANPSCWYQVHPEPEFGGFCCRKCHWRFTTGSKSKKKHGEKCLMHEPAGTLPRAEPWTPDRPL